MSNTANNGPWTVSGTPVFAAGSTTITLTAPFNLSIALNGFVTKGIVATYHVGCPGTSVALGTQATTGAPVPVNILSANVGAKTFTVVGDFANLFTTPWTQVGVLGSTSNNGPYTLVSAVFGGVNTVITVTTSPISAAGTMGTIQVIDEFATNSGPAGDCGTGLTINVTGIT